MRKIIFAMLVIAAEGWGGLSAHAQCVNPKAKHCMCTQTTDPRAALGYNPADDSGQTVRAPWTCTDMDTMQVSYHDGRAGIASNPTVNVKLVSPGGGTYSADFVPPQ